MINSYNKKIISRLALASFCAILPVLALAGIKDAEPIERIIARVGNYPILVSELATQVQLLAMQTGFSPTDTAEIKKFQAEVLDQLINEKLFLIAAQQDTTLRVSQDEVDEALDQQIDQISSRFPTEQGFLDALSADGLTLRELRRKFYPDIENRLLKDRFIQRKLSGINVSRQEVAEFYEKFKDSLPSQPAGVRIAHILLEFSTSDETSDSVKQIATDIRKKAIGETDFIALADRYSAPPAGDLGFVRREEVTPEFGNGAFALQVGDISGLVRTKVGYHILKCLERIGDSIRVAQIFFPLEATPIDSANVWSRGYVLRDSLKSGSSFAEFAKEYSSDDDTRRTEGELGWYAYSDLPKEFINDIGPGANVDDIIGPVQSAFGLHLIKVLEKQVESDVTMEDSFDQIREFARRQKTDRLINEWIERHKQETYIEIRSLDNAQ